MTPHAFVRKWQEVKLSERSSVQSHFNDLCTLLGEPSPTDADPTGEWYTFEKGVAARGGKGFADVWKKGHFGWEYKAKGKHKTLAEAYEQLLRYREALDNPPLLIVSDIARIEIRTNFTNCPTHVHELALADFADPAKLELVRRVFRDPLSFQPGKTRTQVTEEIAGRFEEVAAGLRVRGVDSEKAAHFLVRLVFCMFVEHAKMLTADATDARPFTAILKNGRTDPKRLSRRLADLFDKMAHGGGFGEHDIRHFNGGLFDDAEVIELTVEEVGTLLSCAECDWSGIEPTISGTLFERIIDPDKRAQLGAHFTSRADIETLLNPVFLAPLKREWEAVRAEADELWAKVQPAAKEASLATKREEDKNLKRRSRATRQRFDAHVHKFFDRLTSVTVLDPACGSGNFLYVALRMLLDLHKEVWLYAATKDVTRIPFVTPRQFYGLEVNAYARELAETMLWIGYLQWDRENPIRELDSPVLGAMDHVQRMDAILDLSDPDRPREPDWPDAEFIVGNPPFMGGKLLRSRFDDRYVNSLFRVWGDRLPNFSDLCCYWFEKARALVESGRTKRVGLLATQGIRGGASREALTRIKRSGDIFFAVSDREWPLDGASVHVSMVGFDGGAERVREIDGRRVETINPNLTAAADVTTARRLASAEGRSFIGVQKSGPFDVPADTAHEWLRHPPIANYVVSDALRLYRTAEDMVRRTPETWIVLISSTDEADASLYGAPFDYLQRVVPPSRIAGHFANYPFWRTWRPRDEMYAAVRPLERFIVTPHVSKYRLFGWAEPFECPSNLLIAVAADDNYTFGVLHSRIHEVWARAQGTQVRERESGFRYTPTTCFETFPFPDLFAALRAEIAAAAKRLDQLRTNWLNPPEWTRTEVLEFPGSADGPWKRYVTAVDPTTGIGTVRYPRVVPRDAVCAAKLKGRTLTALYNEMHAGRHDWLRAAHRKLDELVSDAYGWSPDLPDDDLLARLLERNLEQAERQQTGAGARRAVTARPRSRPAADRSGT